MDDLGPALREIQQGVSSEFGKGKVADYIPALARVPAGKFGMAVCSVDGGEWICGDAEETFSIQSISKVFTLLLALEHSGAKLWERVGREPSGSAFNSLVLLEAENGIPRNPFINAGALVVTDCVASHSVSSVHRLLSLVRAMSGNEHINIDEEVARSEAEHGHRNAAIAHFLKSHGNLVSEVDAVLNVYFRQCAIAMSCLDLARAFLPFANKGVAPKSGQVFFPAFRARRINSLLLTCGLYDGVGDFAFRVGIPAKSGVGGGVAAVVPGRLSICVWSPELDRLGNSLVGTAALEMFAAKTGLSVF
jgi:glutaminase